MENSSLPPIDTNLGEKSKLFSFLGSFIFLTEKLLFFKKKKKDTTYNCGGAVLEIYLSHKFQWPLGSLNCESLAYEVVPEDDTIAVWNLHLAAELSQYQIE